MGERFSELNGSTLLTGKWCHSLNIHLTIIEHVQLLVSFVTFLLSSGVSFVGLEHLAPTFVLGGIVVFIEDLKVAFQPQLYEQYEKSREAIAKDS